MPLKNAFGLLKRLSEPKTSAKKKLDTASMKSIDDAFSKSCAADILPEIEKDSKEIVEKIKQYSIAQKDIWRKVPYLALEADGRSGHSEHYQLAFEKGYWGIALKSAQYDFYVDLYTGELVGWWPNRNKPADSTILSTAFNLDKLDAEKIVDELIEASKQKYPIYYDTQKQELWRESKRTQFNVKPIYERKN